MTVRFKRGVGGAALNSSIKFLGVGLAAHAGVLLLVHLHQRYNAQQEAAQFHTAVQASARAAVAKGLEPLRDEIEALKKGLEDHQKVVLGVSTNLSAAAEKFDRDSQRTLEKFHKDFSGVTTGLRAQASKTAKELDKTVQLLEAAAQRAALAHKKLEIITDKSERAAQLVRDDLSEGLDKALAQIRQDGDEVLAAIDGEMQTLRQVAASLSGP